MAEHIKQRRYIKYGKKLDLFYMQNNKGEMKKILFCLLATAMALLFPVSVGGPTTAVAQSQQPEILIECANPGILYIYS
jgi:hypothetical protein